MRVRSRIGIIIQKSLTPSKIAGGLNAGGIPYVYKEPYSPGVVRIHLCNQFHRRAFRKRPYHEK